MQTLEILMPVAFRGNTKIAVGIEPPASSCREHSMAAKKAFQSGRRHLLKVSCLTS